MDDPFKRPYWQRPITKADVWIAFCVVPLGFLAAIFLPILRS